MTDRHQDGHSDTQTAVFVEVAPQLKNKRILYPNYMIGKLKEFCIDKYVFVNNVLL